MSGQIRSKTMLRMRTEPDCRTMNEEEVLTKLAKIADVVLGAAGIFLLGVFVYCVYHYAWVQDRVFSDFTGPLLYYVFPAVMAALCIASLRLRPSLKANVAVALVAMGVSIYAAEVALTIWFSSPSIVGERRFRENARAAQEQGIAFDTRSILDVTNDLRKQGVDAYPIFPPVDVLKEQPGYGEGVLPLGGISNKVSVMCNESGEYVIYESDEHGFHNPKGFWSKGRFDIVALGDSYVHGFCVPPGKNFVALIRQSYPATLNVGTAAMGPLLMLAAMKEYAQTVKPKVVLWFYFEGNDLQDLNVESKNPLPMRYMEKGFSQELLNRQSEIDQAVADYVETAIKTRKWKQLNEIWDAVRGLSAPSKQRMRAILTLSRLRASLGLVYGGNRPSYDNKDRSKASERSSANAALETNLDLFSKILLHAKEVADSWGGKLYFIYLPHWGRYAQPNLADRNRNQVLRIAQNAGLSVIDLHPVFQAQKDPLALFPFRLRNHYTEAGHRLVAEEVLRSISLPAQTAAEGTTAID